MEVFRDAARHGAPRRESHPELFTPQLTRLTVSPRELRPYDRRVPL